jgi:DNA-binding MarR family transcriptional regulator
MRGCCGVGGGCCFLFAEAGVHATLRCGPALAPFGLTPARFDVLYALTESCVPKTQSGLRRAFGLARATICEMLATLEKLGWVVRSRNRDDRRTFNVSLTDRGRALLERAYEGLVGSGAVPLAVESALSRGNALVDVFPIREQLEELCTCIRRFFGDASVRELYQWHPDEYLSALVVREAYG